MELTPEQIAWSATRLIAPRLVAGSLNAEHVLAALCVGWDEDADSMGDLYAAAVAAIA